MKKRTGITHFATSIVMSLILTAGVMYVSPVFSLATEDMQEPEPYVEYVDDEILTENEISEADEILGAEPKAVVYNDYLVPHATLNSYNGSASGFYYDLYANSDGTFLKLGNDYVSSQLRVEKLSSDFKVKKVLTIPYGSSYDFDKVGCMYTDGKYIYAVTSRKIERGLHYMYLFKYDMDFKKLGSVKLPTGGLTYSPFYHGAAKMVSVGKYVYIRANHLLPQPAYIYNYGPSLGASEFDTVSFKVDTDTMEVKNYRYSLASNCGDGGVFGPLNQFIKADDEDNVYALDQGGFYPDARGLFLTKLNPDFGPNGNDKVHKTITIKMYTEAYGQYIYNTQSNIGGLELTSGNIVSVGKSCGRTASSGWANVYYTVTPKDNFTAEATEYINLTNYTNESSHPTNSNPLLVKISDTRLMVLWDEYLDNIDNSYVNYVFLTEDGTGKITAGSVNRIDKAHVSIVNPAYDKTKKRVVWYWGDGTQLVFHSIDIASNKASTNIAAKVPAVTPTPKATPTPTKKPDSTPTPTNAPGGRLPFSDVVAGKWYITPIRYVYENGIMKGTGNGSTFEPNSPCTREMMVQILYSSAGSPYDFGDNPFSDVIPGKWYERPVRWAYKYSITSGKTPTTFGIGESVTREQVATFLMNYAKQTGKDTSGRADLSGFNDSSQISGWAKDAVRWANYHGIINGKSATSLDPKGKATRAEMAQMIMVFKQKL